MLRTPLLPSPAPQVYPVSSATQRVRAWGLMVLPLVLIVGLYVAASTGPAIFDQNEAQYAGAVREMMDRPADYLASTRGQLERGHWWIPTNDGIPRLQKPPLVYWMLMASMRVCGVNEFAARLPNALFTLLWLGATFLVGRRIGGNRLGAAGATILGTMAGTFIFSHLIAPEPFLAAFLTLTFWCFLSALQAPERAGRWMFLAWVFMGLGVASKGLHGALYPLIVAGGLAWRYPETRPVWRKLLRPAGPLVALALLAPWYAAIERRYPGFLWDQFINEQWGHVVNRRFPPDNERVPLWTFALEHLVFFLPWTFFIPAAWASGRQAATEEKGSGVRAEQAGAGVGWSLLGGWFGVTAGTLLFSSLQDYYLMTAWAPVALFLALPWAQGDDGGRRLPRLWRIAPGWGVAGLGGLVLVAGVSLSAHGAGTVAGVGAASSAQRDTILATLAGFSAAAWCRLLPLIWLAAGLLLAGGMGAVWLAARGWWMAVLAATAVMMVGLLGVAARGMSVLEAYFSLKQIALTANRLAGKEALVVCAGLPVDNPSLLFYLDRQIYWLHADPAREFASRERKIGAGLFLSDEAFAREWNSPREVFLIREADDATEAGLVAGRERAVERSGTRVLVENQGQR